VTTISDDLANVNINQNGNMIYPSHSEAASTGGKAWVEVLIWRVDLTFKPHLVMEMDLMDGTNSAVKAEASMQFASYLCSLDFEALAAQPVTPPLQIWSTDLQVSLNQRLSTQQGIALMEYSLPYTIHAFQVQLKG